jgi:hypothetical protein
MITRTHLRRLVESVLLEGYKDDQRYLIDALKSDSGISDDKKADLIQAVEKLKPKWIAWLIARFGDSPTKGPETLAPQSKGSPMPLTLEAAVALIKKFASKDDGLSRKYRESSWFKKDIDQFFPPGSRGWRDWSNPQEAMNVSAQQLDVIMGISLRPERDFEIKSTREDLKKDMVGQVGPWNIYVPSTTERSCAIAGQDPVTLKPRTSWCTGRQSENLYFGYSLDDKILFTVERENPTRPEHVFTIYHGADGFNFEEDNPLSLTADSRTITRKRLKKIVGEYYDQFMSFLESKIREWGGTSPNTLSVIEASKSVEKMEGFLSDKDDDDRLELIDSLYRYVDDVPTDVEMYMIQKYPEVASAVIWHTKNREILDFAMTVQGAKGKEMRSRIPMNPNCPDDIMSKLLNGEEGGPRKTIAVWTRDRSTIERLANDDDPWVRSALFSNKEIPLDVIKKLANDDNEHVRKWALNLLAQKGMQDSPTDVPPGSLQERLLRKLIRASL